MGPHWSCRTLQLIVLWEWVVKYSFRNYDEFWVYRFFTKVFFALWWLSYTFNIYVMYDSIWFFMNCIYTDYVKHNRNQNSQALKLGLCSRINYNSLLFTKQVIWLVKKKKQTWFSKSQRADRSNFMNSKTRGTIHLMQHNNSSLEQSKLKLKQQSRTISNKSLTDANFNIQTVDT